MEVAKNMDSVFATSADSETDFDVMFDQEDSLIDTVNGVNEAGDPLTGVDFVDLHQTQDDATAKDVKDGQADDNDMGNKNAEGTKEIEPTDNSKNELDKDSEADKLYKDAEDKYQEDKEKNPKIEDDDINDAIDKVTEGASLVDTLLEADDEEVKTDAEEDTVDEAGDVTTDSIEDEIGSEDDDVTDESCDVNVESIEDEIDKEKDKPVKEAGDIDEDVAKVDASDEDSEEDIIDAAIGLSKPAKKVSTSSKYQYDVSDEDLIDMAINGD